MKKTKKVALVTGLLIATTMTVVAAFTHSSDQFNFGPEPNPLPWAWDQSRQYSHFYCGEQKHHATAIMKDSDGQEFRDRTDAPAGKWAKARTSYVKNPSEWNSYYGHD
ncbi:lactococcin 972 family bacteriocin [Clostridium simiarum]|uniref:lactococcin 972 family bacteriocin n=1 Tax=Clostridium simiarum TaxID=2841506 RepID=UPI001C12853B|nr:lactococcin 972 family bacteriocin [Clostridium simiarum]